MKQKFDYDKISNICLTADGGNCFSCAVDVAEGFAKEYPELNLKKLVETIRVKDKLHKVQLNKKMEAYLKKDKQAKEVKNE